ncbi:hypothetical protein COEREDRAFT_86270 [Coemansia reversa NRRL 1564]|uniref:Uncharacterized protein n=1 Tax=Coemansia reversa (strain ATCC 12441 / NRRL 1564) TaxID=763665 RepID=A0A2G5BE46_COERN|nr:hypothetical protein COEREDRAFT_86270 [Coemansia reversa NRRL 1564]|eukprot:PIA17271.1 hypothetical protein COEREDRAFT_86270 [Coemansia reversa NRRL 1564]
MAYYSSSDDDVDYFSLVETCGETALNSTKIEKGLAIATNNIARYTGHTSHCASIILQRFVYTDRDRCSPKATSLALAMLKMFSRQPDGISEISSENAIHGLLRLVRIMCLDSEDVKSDAGEHKAYTIDACNETLTCVANAMLLHPECRTYVSEHHCLEAIAELLRAMAETPTTAFLCARCLLLALGTKESAKYCVEQLQLQIILAQTVEFYLHRELAEECSNERFTPLLVMTELLKAAMSLCTYYLRWIHSDVGLSDKPSNHDDAFPAKNATEFALLLKACLDTINALPLVNGHLSGPAKQAGSIVMNFPTRNPEAIKDIWLPNDNMWRNVDSIYKHMASIVDFIVDKSEEDSLKTATSSSNAGDKIQDELTPLLLVLMRLVSEHANVRERIFRNVYPASEIDYNVLPEDRPGLSAKLVRLMRNPHGGMLPNAIGDFILALVGHDIKQFIMAVGYGNAAGYMLVRGIEIPQEIIDQVKSDMAGKSIVDPVTGRYISTDADRELADMTDEEKEREAERLFVLFERLNRTGIIKVENPVRVAAESGRFMEMDDDTSDNKKR